MPDREVTIKERGMLININSAGLNYLVIDRQIDRQRDKEMQMYTFTYVYRFPPEVL